jgi:DNA-binding HxlR family transcriptional regulator
LVVEMPGTRRYPEVDCGTARALEIVGERWTLLIVRSLMLGSRRFGELEAALGVSTNMLERRLDSLVRDGLVVRKAYGAHPSRFDYLLTERGKALFPVIASLMQWGDEQIGGGEGPVSLTHEGCGGLLDSHRMCSRCGSPLEIEDVVALATPAAGAEHPLRRSGPRRLAGS